MFHWHKQPVFLLLNSWHGIRERFKNTGSNDIGGKNLSTTTNNYLDSQNDNRFDLMERRLCSTIFDSLNDN